MLLRLPKLLRNALLWMSGLPHGIDEWDDHWLYAPYLKEWSTFQLPNEVS